MEKKNLIQYLDMTYNYVLNAEKVFENNTNITLKKLLLQIHNDLEKLLNDSVLKSAAENGVNSQNIDVYISGKTIAINILDNLKELYLYKFDDFQQNLAKNSISIAISTMEKNVLNKMNNKIQEYNLKQIK